MKPAIEVLFVLIFNFTVDASDIQVTDFHARLPVLVSNKVYHRKRDCEEEAAKQWNVSCMQLEVEK